jgi:alpha-glucosidase (family GH31 glycosyl hydrolase)
MRAMVLEFPDEEKIYTDSNQFMWGDYLLVAPVIEEGARSRDIYLPAGKWYRFDSSAALDGGKSISENVTLASLPLFVREGAIMPLAPVMQYTWEKPWSPLTIEFYAGSKKSCFNQYEDDGKSFNYAKGEYLQTQYCQEPIDNGYRITKAAGQGSFHPIDREVILKMFGQKKPTSVLINQGAGFDKVGYSYDAQTQILEVRLKDSAKGFEIKINY